MAAGGAARFASRALGRGSGGMIGGEVALRISPKLLKELAAPCSSVIVTGTNGKSTTTRMVRAALESAGRVASNINGDNMTSGVLTALMQGKGATRAALEVDEMHVPAVAADVDPAVFVYLNLSRDQLDRVGEIGTVERRLREGASAHPDAVVVANCDDPLIASAAADNPNVVWVAAGGGWGGDSAAYPRGGRVVRSGDDWHLIPAFEGEELPELTSRPQPQWWLEEVELSPEGPRATLTSATQRRRSPQPSPWVSTRLSRQPPSAASPRSPGATPCTTSTGAVPV